MSLPGTGRVAFIGIGNMGWPMAARLVGAGYDIAACDAVPGRAGTFVYKIGGEAAGDATAAARGAEVVITMLPTSTLVASVTEEIRSELRPGVLVIDMSSGVPGVTQRIAGELAALEVEMIDAPVSGGVSRAETGQLSIMTGGTEAACARAEPLLRCMGTTITRIGAVGAGQAMKALNNLVSAGGFLIGIEALLIGQKFGLDPELMVDVLNASTGMNNSTQKKFRQFVLSRRFDSGFSLDLMAKDLSIALEVGRDAAVATPFAALCRELWTSARSLLGTGQDHTAMARFSEQLAGERLGDRIAARPADEH
jgi:3-hydroxyisobutyrate dehydrogenase